ncbi:MAG: DUF4384 domain-containing protein [bacterium]|nr:DUF4384 domain-containing protein [bacterium]
MCWETVRLTTVFLVFLTAFGIGKTFADTPNPTKRALIVAISQYDRGGPDDWWNLNSSGDAEAISALLQRRFGFDAENILVLSGIEETTSAKIITAFEQWLIKATKPGDIVYFHYSGHGTEIPDDNGDEIDGLDECLVPSDYISRHDGSANIRDDRLADLLDQLDSREPASVTLTFDCCYSGTATRGGRQLVRGQSWTGATPAVRRGNADEAKKDAGVFLSRTHPTEANYVVLSATSQGQVASETDDGAGGTMGLFTWAFTQAAAEARTDCNYRSLFEQVTNLMLERNRAQTPQIEGRLDEILFNGQYVPTPQYLPITQDSGLGLLLEAGTLQGMTEGSVLGIYPAGTMNFKDEEPVARARISNADLNYCELTLEPEFSGTSQDSVFRASRAIEEVHQYGEIRIEVDLSKLSHWPSLPALQDQIKILPQICEATAGTSGWNIRITAPKNGIMRMEKDDGSLLREFAVTSESHRTIASALEGVARWHFINDLENSDPYAQVAIELKVVPVEVAFDADGYVTGVVGDLSSISTVAGPPEFPVGTFVMLELRNTGFVDAYVTVLDLKSDGSIGPLWPHPGLRVQDNRIVADNEWHRIPEPFIFQLEEPLGPELFKAIATAEPADFSPLLDPETIASDTQERGSSPLSELLRAATLGQRAQSAVASGNWAVSSGRFRVIDR